ncbi:MAG: hypothetical protein E5W41_00500, partial [Mesorhizobium sp.]
MGGNHHILFRPQFSVQPHVASADRLEKIVDQLGLHWDGAFFGHGHADDHLEIGRPVGPTAHIATIDADRHGWSRDWHPVPF